MKRKMSMLIVLLMAVVTFTQAQSKKDIEDNLANCTATKDSIQNVLTGLTATYDSISKVCIAYDTMYAVIKEKVLLQDFDPANMSQIIDSLRAEQSSVFAAALNDSLSGLKQENTELKASLVDSDDDSEKVVNELKQLKGLLDEGIITQEEFDTKKAVLLEKL